VLAHGAGAEMDSEFMNYFAEGLAERDFRVVRFEFPYMAARRRTGKKGPPDREPVLRQTWLQVIDSLGADALVIGGKSMGGRIASLVADGAAAAGLICLGYPFHPTGDPEKLRIEHLKTIKTPTLILQGERDPFGNKAEVTGMKLSKNIRLHWLADGDHSFKPRKSSGRTEEQNWREAVETFAQFAGGLFGAS
jgi:predicted alpha/beta-hydrolase family hydrolase